MSARPQAVPSPLLWRPGRPRSPVAASRAWGSPMEAPSLIMRRKFRRAPISTAPAPRRFQRPAFRSPPAIRPISQLKSRRRPWAPRSAGSQASMSAFPCQSPAIRSSTISRPMSPAWPRCRQERARFRSHPPRTRPSPPPPSLRASLSPSAARRALVCRGRRPRPKI